MSGLAAATWFVTGLGGFVTLPVTVPAAMAGLYIIATRMTVASPTCAATTSRCMRVRSGTSSSRCWAAPRCALRNTGVQIGQRSTAAALQRLPGRMLTELNKRVGYRLVTKAGRRASST